MITKRHGYYIPPRKKKPNRENCVTIRLVLPGIVPAKKNRQIATINRNKILKQISNHIKAAKSLEDVSMEEINRIVKAEKPYIRHSKKFKEWAEKTKELLVQQAATELRSCKKFNLSYPIQEASISVYHYWTDITRRDNTNRAETIHDLLWQCGIISDDAWQNLSPNKSDADLYEDEMPQHLTVIDITAYRW